MMKTVDVRKEWEEAVAVIAELLAAKDPEVTPRSKCEQAAWRAAINTVARAKKLVEKGAI